MAAQLKGTVYVTDPDTHQTVELAPGTSPEPRLAALVTNPAAWVDGRLPKTVTGSSRTESDRDAVSGGAPEASGGSDTQSDEDSPSEDTKLAARKTAAKKPARGRTAADEGTGGQ